MTVFLASFLNNKNRLFVLIVLLWATAPYSNSHSYPRHPAGYSDAFCGTESHYDKELTPPSLVGSMYCIYLCYYSISPASPPSHSSLVCFSRASLSPPTLLSLLSPVGWRFLSLTANGKQPFREE